MHERDFASITIRIDGVRINKSTVIKPAQKLLRRSQFDARLPLTRSECSKDGTDNSMPGVLKECGLSTRRN